MSQSSSLIDCHVISRFPTKSRVASKFPAIPKPNPCNKTRAVHVTRSRNHTSPSKKSLTLLTKPLIGSSYQPTAFDHDHHLAGPVRNRPRGVTSWQK